MTALLHVAFYAAFLLVVAGLVFLWPVLLILTGFAVMVTVFYVGARAHLERGNNA